MSNNRNNRGSGSNSNMNSGVKYAGSGAIIAVLTASLIGVISWIAVQASEVPVLKQTLKIEVENLNKNLVKLTDTADETNSQLRSYTEYHAKNLSVITESLIRSDFRIKQLEISCEEAKERCEADLKAHQHRINERGSK